MNPGNLDRAGFFKKLYRSKTIISRVRTVTCVGTSCNIKHYHLLERDKLLSKGIGMLILGTHHHSFAPDYILIPSGHVNSKIDRYKTYLYMVHIPLYDICRYCITVCCSLNSLECQGKDKANNILLRWLGTTVLQTVFESETRSFSRNNA